MYDLTVIGGGFYGCMLAIHEAKKGKSVCLIEQRSDLMLQASYGNQAIIHRGYHYPRSIKTGLSSSKNYSRFMKEFKSCVYDKHKKYHAIAKKASHVTSKDYIKFCKQVGSPCKKVDVLKSKKLDGVFLTPETSFDASKLRDKVLAKLKSLKVTLKLNTEAISFKNGVVESFTNTENGSCVNKTHTKHVAICTYSSTNDVLEAFGLPEVDLKYQLAEMVLVDVPAIYKKTGLTVMDGPFFSLTPFPSKNCHVISHVQHSVHAQWKHGMDVKFNINEVKSNFSKIQEAVLSFFPDLHLNYKESIYEVKALLPESCHDDGRPILVARPTENVTVFVGSKIDNVYDMLDYVDDNSLIGKNIHEISNK